MGTLIVILADETILKPNCSRKAHYVALDDKYVDLFRAVLTMQFHHR